MNSGRRSRKAHMRLSGISMVSCQLRAVETPDGLARLGLRGRSALLYAKIPARILSLAVLAHLDRLDDQVARLGLIAPADHLGPLAVFEILVALKEVRNLP
jgi:hypothetical protein